MNSLGWPGGGWGWLRQASLASLASWASWASWLTTARWPAGQLLGWTGWLAIFTASQGGCVFALFFVS